MSVAYHRFNNNSEVQAFTCGIGVASQEEYGVVGPYRWVVDTVTGERHGKPFFAALVQTDDNEETPEDDIPIVDHREHV